MAIKAGKVLRTASAASRKFLAAAHPAPSAVSPPGVTSSSAVGAFLGIIEVPRSTTDMLISKYIRLSQNRLTKKGDFTEEKLMTMLSGNVGISETVKLLDGRKTSADFSSPKSTNVPSIAKPKKKK
ncbi:hypothetical protein HID58_021760 [Brassica napus]|uniref:BnaA06g11790D protein n=2 Tax=Brassica napus TaxID=3708 RepID=A0A078GNM8_BRANA|nr:uncharacterized protein LOC106351392 [Brassica napus]XP_048638363.1 uncharacterized protein LOC106351392 [Brassica napus]KAH0921742.1 hypothetical protein HID58_021760 [Brassica napus]CAF2083718.1 unnamed protein product [Brassica napus]CDY26238.1 BnaA06g11790D [Brassica napus]